MAQAYNLSIWEAQAQELEVQGQSQPYNKLKASLGNETVSKTKQTNKQTKPETNNKKIDK